MSARWRALGAALLGSLPMLRGLGAQSNGGEIDLGFTEEELRKIATHAPLGEPPLDETNAAFADPRAARLGQRLFFDARTSVDGQRACATCHQPERGLAEGVDMFYDLFG